MPEGLDPQLEKFLEYRDRFGRHVAVLIVITTLLGAGVASLQACAVLDHDEATIRADQLATLGSAQRNRAEQAVQLLTERQRLAHVNRLRAEQATARRVLAPNGDGPRLSLESELRQRLADQIDRGSVGIAKGLHDEIRDIQCATRGAFPNVDFQGRARGCAVRGDDGTIAPPPAPTSRDPDLEDKRLAQYEARAYRESHRLDALRDAATTTAETAETQFTRYAVSLALFAVAVFLFGYSLTPYGRRYRRAYATFAACFAVGSLGWGISSLMRGPEHPREQAAAAYADGLVALEVGDYRHAIKHLSRAISLRDEFAAAYAARGQAYIEAGTPQDSPIINESMTDPRARERATEDERRAHELHADDPELKARLAPSIYAAGLEHDDRSALEEALRLDQEARKALPADPISAFNTGTTLLALGRPWRAGYEEAEARMHEQLDPSQYVNAALTDLEELARQRPALTAEIRQAKEHVVTASYSDAAGSEVSDQPQSDRSARATFHGVRLDVRPRSLGLRMPAAAGFDRSRDRLFAAWYHRTGRHWVAIPEASGPVTKLTRAGSREYFARTPLQSFGTCLESGEYKLELYVNGRLAVIDPPASTTVNLPELVQASPEDLNVKLCRPRDWARVPGAISGLADGYVSPDRSQGIVVFDVSASPGARRGPGAALEVALSHFGHLLPRRARPLGAQPGGYFMGLQSTEVRRFGYPGGRMILAAGRTERHRTLVAAVFWGAAPALSGFDAFHSVTTFTSL